MKLYQTAKSYYTSINHSSNTLEPLDSPPRRSRTVSAKAWATTLWPLIAHLALSLGLVAFLVYYVDNNDVSTGERPAYSLTYFNGTRGEYERHIPLQSYITSAVSAWLVVLRWVTVAWGGALCWRGAFLLMESSGLPERDLERMVSYGLPLSSTVYKRGLGLFITLTLVIGIVAQSLSPVLTGSITWTPSPPRHLSRDLVQITTASAGWRWDRYADGTPLSVITRRRVYGGAVELATLAWAKSNATGSFKRVLHETGLNIGSTITNVTLPYFSISNFEWVTDIGQLDNTTANLDIDNIRESIGIVSNTTLLDDSGHFAFIPDNGVRWSSTRRLFTAAGTPYNGLPNSTTISETRMLVVIVYPGRVDSETSSPPCSSKSAGLFANDFPHQAKLFSTGGFCCALARVTYTAGAAECTQCRLSSPFVVETNTTVGYTGDTMTNEAWWMMPHITYHLVQLLGNRIGVSGYMGRSIESHIKEILLRAYSAGWNALQDAFNIPDQPLTSEFSAVLPTLTARVDKSRLWAWLIAQFLVTLSSAGFVVVLAKSQNPLLGDTSMVPFYTDSTEVTNGKSSSRRILRVRPEGKHWKIGVD